MLVSNLIEAESVALGPSIMFLHPAKVKPCNVIREASGEVVTVAILRDGHAQQAARDLQG
jgi:hypothetical protein